MLLASDWSSTVAITQGFYALGRHVATGITQGRTILQAGRLVPRRRRYVTLAVGGESRRATRVHLISQIFGAGYNPAVFLNVLQLRPLLSFGVAVI